MKRNNHAFTLQYAAMISVVPNCLAGRPMWHMNAKWTAIPQIINLCCMQGKCGCHQEPYAIHQESTPRKVLPPSTKMCIDNETGGTARIFPSDSTTMSVGRYSLISCCTTSGLQSSEASTGRANDLQYQKATVVSLPCIGLPPDWLSRQPCR